MKKLLLWMAVLLAVLAVSASAEGNRLLTLEDEYITGLASDGETLYIVADANLYTWKPGDDAPTAWENDLVLSEESGERAELYELQLYADGEGIHAVRGSYDDEAGASSLTLFDLAFTDDGKVEAANVRPLALPGDLRAVEYLSLRGVCEQEGRLVLLCDGDGSYMLLATLDPEHPGDARVETVDTWEAQLVPTDQGALLNAYHFDIDESYYELSRVAANGGLEPLCRLPEDVRGVAADPETGAVYAVLEGKACPVDTDTGELGAPFGALPLQASGAAVLAGGQGYAVAMNSRVAVLDPAGALDEENLMTIYAGNADYWLQNAVLEYSVQHPELPATLVESYRTTDEILGDMLAHSAVPDIYLMYRSEEACDAILQRGYALPLEGEALKALADRFYPGVLQGVAPEGELLAVPVGEIGYTMGVSSTLMEKLGLSVDEVPGDWLGFLDFLEEKVKPRMDELGPGDHFTYVGMTDSTLRSTVFNLIMNSYDTCCIGAGREIDYSNPDLLAVLERLDAMDFTEYGLVEESDEGFFSFSSDEHYLVQFDMCYDFTDSDVEGVPLPLGFGDDLPGALPLVLQVALVNPFSPHAAEAAALLEQIVGSIPNQVLYALCPDLDEPVPNPEADTVIADIEAEIAELEARLDSAEPADRQAIQDELDSGRSYLEAYRENNMWLISRERLDGYRANGERIVAARPSWFMRDTTGEAWDLMSQYEDRQINAAEFLAAVDRKAKMMALEG